MISTTSLRNSLLITVLAWTLIGCTTTVSNPDGGLTPFPPAPEWKVYTNKPIVSFDKKDKTYKVTQDFMYNMKWEHTYLDAILEWKKSNKIE